MVFLDYDFNLLSSLLPIPLFIFKQMVALGISFHGLFSINTVPLHIKCKNLPPIYFHYFLSTTILYSVSVIYITFNVYYKDKTKKNQVFILIYVFLKMKRKMVVLPRYLSISFHLVSFPLSLKNSKSYSFTIYSNPCLL